MHTKLQHLKTAIVTTLVAGITMTTGSTVSLKAELSGGGTMLTVPDPYERVLSYEQGMHGAAPALSATASVAQTQLLLGMVLILAGFALSLVFVRAERSVHITVKPGGKGKRLSKKPRMEVKEWIWMRMEI